MSPILTPRCPLCDQPPAFGLMWLEPWFCANEKCDALTWEPRKSLDENLMNAGKAKITTEWSMPPEERS